MALQTAPSGAGPGAQHRRHEALTRNRSLVEVMYPRMFATALAKLSQAQREQRRAHGCGSHARRVIAGRRRVTGLSSMAAIRRGDRQPRGPSAHSRCGRRCCNVPGREIEPRISRPFGFAGEPISSPLARDRSAAPQGRSVGSRVIASDKANSWRHHCEKQWPASLRLPLMAWSTAEPRSS
jgi:hypothetical protein